jgi:hypothetical protein
VQRRVEGGLESALYRYLKAPSIPLGARKVLGRTRTRGSGQAPGTRSSGFSPEHVTASHLLPNVIPFLGLQTGANSRVQMQGSGAGLSQHLEGPQGAKVCVPSTRHASPQQKLPLGQQSSTGLKAPAPHASTFQHVFGGRTSVRVQILLCRIPRFAFFINLL